MTRAVQLGGDGRRMRCELTWDLCCSVDELGLHIVKERSLDRDTRLGRKFVDPVEIW